MVREYILENPVCPYCKSENSTSVSRLSLLLLIIQKSLFTEQQRKFLIIRLHMFQHLTHQQAYQEAQKVLEEFRKQVADTKYGYLFEPQIVMYFYVKKEFLEIAEKGKELAKECEPQLILGMKKQVEYYLQNVPTDFQYYYLIEAFNTMLTAYVKEHCGQFIPKRKPHDFKSRNRI